MAKKNRDNQPQDQNDSMNRTLASATSDEGFWREMWRQVRLAWYLIRSPEVPLYLKLLPALAVIYVLLPTDFIPDVFPILGQLDDVTALLVGAKVFIELAPQDVVAQYMRTARRGAPAATSEEGADGQDLEEIDDLIVIEGDFDLVEENEKDQAD
ncbi:MAG: DUF1232 domain-containing protein [Chloroflexota bacterium]|jgi:uncharacterized membrane protein YkvA (DUF1232 family)